jgi:hypothetical protein
MQSFEEQISAFMLNDVFDFVFLNFYEFLMMALGFIVVSCHPHQVI